MTQPKPTAAQRRARPSSAVNQWAPAW
jgi:hypothetical protein